MKRRKALLGISLLTGGALFSFVGFQWLRFNTSPDFISLIQNPKLIASLADCIIPKSDSPSASECGVHDFMIKMIIENTDARSQNNFVSGLIALEEYSNSHYGKSFSVLSDYEKNKIVSHFSERDKTEQGVLGKIKKKILGKSFFATLKEYTVIGYFTSEQGANSALRYSLVPGKYISCQSYAPGEKAWATY